MIAQDSILSFEGNNFEIGRQLGELYKKWGLSFYPVQEPDLLKRQIRIYEQYAPEILEEVRGVAHGHGTSFFEIANRYLLGEVYFIRSRKKRCCSIGGFRDQDGNHWVVRNYDWHPIVSKNFKIFYLKNGERSCVAISDMGMLDETSVPLDQQFFCPQDLVNKHGLYIGITYAYCWKEQVGVTSNHIRRLVIERCKTVEEAITLFEKTPVAVGKNFFIADKHGSMAVIQHGVTSFDVRMPDQDGVLALTNHYIGPLKEEDEIYTTSPKSTTWKRYDSLTESLRQLSHQKNITFDTLRLVMNGDETPVFQFLPQYLIETCWTLLMNLQKEDVYLIRDPNSNTSGMDKIELPSEASRK